MAHAEDEGTGRDAFEAVVVVASLVAMVGAVAVVRIRSSLKTKKLR